MNTTSPSSHIDTLEIRPAERPDHGPLANLLAVSIHLHQHLDWVAPLELLGQQPFLMAILDGQPAACLACPIDPEDVAWIRLFALRAGFDARTIWSTLWNRAEEMSRKMGARYTASIITNYRFTPLVQASHFGHTQDVIFMEWNGDEAPAMPDVPGFIRPLHPADLPQVASVDQAAFQDIWRYSVGTLSSALQQAAWATVVEVDNEIIGYQLTTLAPFGAHLARLAVLPNWQRKHIGRALVTDLLQWANRGGDSRISVNTQSDNLNSQRLYHKLGFKLTGLSYPVYRKTL